MLDEVVSISTSHLLLYFTDKDSISMEDKYIYMKGEIFNRRWRQLIEADLRETQNRILMRIKR